MFVDQGHDPVELNSHVEEMSQSMSGFTATNEEVDVSVDTVKATVTPPTTEQSSKEPTHLMQDLDSSESLGNVELGLSVNNVPNDLSLTDADNGVDLAKTSTTPAMEQNYEELAAHLVADVDSGELSHYNNMPQGSSGGAQRWCCVEHLLRMRSELAMLRRRLHITDVKRSLLRHLHTHVLLPAAVHGSSQLERRRWLTVRRHKLAAALCLHNYQDFISGWDKGS